MKKFDIRKYVTPYWGETFNFSYRSDGMWSVASKVIKEEYRPLKESESVQARLKYDKSLVVKSSSMTYIEELQSKSSHLAPDPYET